MNFVWKRVLVFHHHSFNRDLMKYLWNRMLGFPHRSLNSLLKFGCWDFLTILVTIVEPATTSASVGTPKIVVPKSATICTITWCSWTSAILLKLRLSPSLWCKIHQQFLPNLKREFKQFSIWLWRILKTWNSKESDPQSKAALQQCVVYALPLHCHG